jgi:hypothetical protein
MRYSDLADDRFQLPSSHPHLATLSIDPADWFRFERMADENLTIRIVGHDAPQDERLTVYVACSSKEVRRRLEDGWG